MSRYRPPTPAGSKYITPEGERRLREELDQLWREERPRVTLAVQAAAAAGKRPVVRLGVALDASGRVACLTVDDNGPGVELSSRERIFDPYVTTKEHGTGLGLAIVRKIVLDHGGDIRLVDAPPPLGGARFVVTLPAVPGVESAAPPRATPGVRRIQ